MPQTKLNIMTFKNSFRKIKSKNVSNFDKYLPYLSLEIVFILYIKASFLSAFSKSFSLVAETGTQQ